MNIFKKRKPDVWTLKVEYRDFSTVPTLYYNVTDWRCGYGKGSFLYIWFADGSQYCRGYEVLELTATKEKP